MASNHPDETGEAARKQSTLAATPQLQGPVMIGDFYQYHGKHGKVAKVIVQGHLVSRPGTVLAEGQVLTTSNGRPAGGGHQR